MLQETVQAAVSLCAVGVVVGIHVEALGRNDDYVGVKWPIAGDKTQQDVVLHPIFWDH